MHLYRIPQCTIQNRKGLFWMVHCGIYLCVIWSNFDGDTQFPDTFSFSRQQHDSPLQWRHNGHDSVSNHQPHDCLLNRLFRRWSKKTSKLRVTGLCAGNSLGTGEFPAQMASNAENVSIWWRHHAHEIYLHVAFLIKQSRHRNSIYTILVTMLLNIAVPHTPTGDHFY